MTNFDDITSVSITSLLERVAVLRMDKDGNLIAPSAINEIRELSEKLLHKLSRLVDSASCVVYHAQTNGETDSGAVWMLASLGEVLGAISKFSELLEQVDLSGKWPSSSEGFQPGYFFSCLVSIPYANSRYRRGFINNLEMMNLAKESALASTELQRINLPLFVSALREAHATGEVQSDMKNALCLIEEWSGLIGVLTDIAEDASCEITRLEESAPKRESVAEIEARQLEGVEA